MEIIIIVIGVMYITFKKIDKFIKEEQDKWGW
jgi:hypothetical protein|nr:MAG TPA: hypothetical protein [Caudoviricetes sp.]